jgi:uroporphyrinogen decarboxylase
MENFKSSLSNFLLRRHVVSEDHLFLRACWREDVERTPVWLMRQAGRYMQAYQKVRAQHSFLEMCRNPRLAAQVTLQPVERLGVDAAILFSDILVLVEAMGMRLEFHEGFGPRLHEPVRSMDGVDRLRVPEAEKDLAYVMEAIKLTREKLRGRVPLIGFSGAPFTLASYVIEGQSSRTFRFTKEMMFSQPEAFNALMEKITSAVIDYLNAQVRAGAQALQIFDSWVGCLAPEDYERYVLPHMQRIFASLDARGEVPVIHFANQAATFLEKVRVAGGDVIGVDWRIPLDEAWRRVGYDVGIQGNLDPLALFAPLEEIERRVRDILDKAGSRPGHIFNLGHGVHKDTPEEKVVALVKMVKKLSAR